MERDTKENGKGLVDFLASLRVTLFLLVLLGLICALGTLVPLTSEYADFRRFLIGGVGRAMLSFGFDKPFTSTSFRIILGLLALNLCFCTLKRLPGLFRAYFSPSAERDEAFFDNGEFRASKGTLPKEELPGVMSSLGYEMVSSSDKEGGGKCHLARRGGLAPFGPHVTHLGVLLLFLGGVIGWYTGFEGYAEAAAGTSFEVYEGEFYRICERMRRLSFLHGFYLDLEKERILTQDDVSTFRSLEKEMASLEKKRQELQKRPRFKVQVLEAREEHYEGNGGVKDWTSVLQVVDGGKAVKTQAIEVNVPLEYGGVTMYQHSFIHRPIQGSGPGAKIASATVGIAKAHKFDKLPLEIEVIEFYADFAVAPSSTGGPRAYSQSDKLNNPAVKLLVKADGDKAGKGIFLFEKPPYVIHEDPASKYKIRLTKVTGEKGKRRLTLSVFQQKSEAWTGVSLQHDSGTFFIWLGSLAMMVGMMLCFYCEHRRVWIYVRADDEVKLAGLAAKFPDAFREEFASIASAFHAELAERSKP